MFHTQQLGVCICEKPLLSMAPIVSPWRTCYAQPFLSEVTSSRQHLPLQARQGHALFGLTLACLCSCSVRFGMWSGARRLIAACAEDKVLLLDAPCREEPLKAEDMLLNGAHLVSSPGTQSATLLGEHC